MAFRDTLKAAQARREILYGTPGGGRIGKLDIAAEGRRGPAQGPRGLDLPDWRPGPRPAPAASEYVGPVPLGEEAAAPEARRGLSEGTRRGLAAALQGASAGIRADVGPARRGSELSQGILKGLVGAGVAQAGAAKMRADEAGREQTLMDKLELLQARKKTSAQIEEEAAAGARGRLPFDLEKLRAAGTLREQYAKATKERNAGMTEAQLVELNNKALDQMDARFKAAYNYNPSEEERQLEFIKIKQGLLSGYKTVGKPKLPD